MAESSAVKRGPVAAGGVPRPLSTQTMMRLYTDDAPGLKVDPVVVLVLSLVFIASVFLLHIYGKLTGTKSD
ncbi:Arf guanine nucleotide exchange factor sbh1 [Coemansia sp. RSA 2705]|nr:Arf guanine nucleotide exchange factor sbh1 [Coemansia sp. RSA 2705]